MMVAAAQARRGPAADDKWRVEMFSHVFPIVSRAHRFCRRQNFDDFGPRYVTCFVPQLCFFVGGTV